MEQLLPIVKKSQMDADPPIFMMFVKLTELPIRTKLRKLQLEAKDA
jgi:hypothetical protein